MTTRIDVTIFHLWQTSVPWRSTVIAASACTIVSIALFVGHSRTPQGPPSPPPTQALLDYKKTYDGLPQGQAQGLRCEQIEGAYRDLSSLDKNLAEHIEGMDRAVREGTQCDGFLATSQKRFQALANALKLADADSGAIPRNIDDVAATCNALDSFDLSRPSERGLIEKAKGYADKLAASNKRIDGFMNVMRGFMAEANPPSASFPLVAEALRTVAADRNRLITADQQASLKAAESAAQMVKASHDRWGALLSALAKWATGQGPSAQKQLSDATVAIVPFDEALATTEQAQALAHARDIVTPLAWSQLQMRLTAYRQEKTATNCQVVAGLYELLSRLPSASLSRDQQSLLKEAESARDTLAASDMRRRHLVEVADTWEQQGVASGQAVLDALNEEAQSLGFDQPQFQTEQTRAWATLQKAQEILLAPSRGFTKATRMCVRPVSGSWDAAGAVRIALQAEKFSVAEDGNCKDAAIFVQITIDKVPHTIKTPEPDDGMMTFITELHVGLSARWVVNNIDLFKQKSIVGQGMDRDRPTSVNAAQADTVRIVIEALSSALAK